MYRVIVNGVTLPGRYNKNAVERLQTTNDKRRINRAVPRMFLLGVTHIDLDLVVTLTILDDHTDEHMRDYYDRAFKRFLSEGGFS